MATTMVEVRVYLPDDVCLWAGYIPDYQLGVDYMTGTQFESVAQEWGRRQVAAAGYVGDLNELRIEVRPVPPTVSRIMVFIGFASDEENGEVVEPENWPLAQSDDIDIVEVVPITAGEEALKPVVTLQWRSLYWCRPDPEGWRFGQGSIGNSAGDIEEFLVRKDGSVEKQVLRYLPDMKHGRMKLGAWRPGTQPPSSMEPIEVEKADRVLLHFDRPGIRRGDMWEDNGETWLCCPECGQVFLLHEEHEVTGVTHVTVRYAGDVVPIQCGSCRTIFSIEDGRVTRHAVG